MDIVIRGGGNGIPIRVIGIYAPHKISEEDLTNVFWKEIGELGEQSRGT